MTTGEMAERRRRPVTVPTVSATVGLHGSTVRVAARGVDVQAIVESATAGLPLAHDVAAPTVDLRFSPAGARVGASGSGWTTRHRLRAARVTRMSAGRWAVSRCADHVDVRYDVLDRHTLRRFIAASLLQGYDPEALHCFHGACVLLPSGDAALLLGSSKVGKSTLSRALAALGCTALAENFVLVDAARRVLPFVDPIVPPPHAEGPAPRLTHLVALAPGSGRLEHRPVHPDAIDPAGHSVSRHFHALYDDASAPRVRGRWPRTLHLFATLRRQCSTSTLRYVHGTDTPDATARTLLHGLLGSHG